MTFRLRGLLWIAWGLMCGLAIASAGMFIHGFIRDIRPFDPAIRLDLASSSEWISEPFRVWGDETYALLIRSLNHDPARVGQPLTAEFDVRVLRPDGEAVFDQSYGAGETGHAVPDDYGDARLGTVQVSDWPLRPWALQVRVTKPDPAFATVRTDLELYEQRSDPGMGGLISYAMFIPSAVFMLLALIAAMPLARRGFRIPLIVTAICSVVVLLILA